MSEMRKTCIGVDPGKSGALAVIRTDGTVRLVEYTGPMCYYKEFHDELSWVIENDKDASATSMPLSIVVERLFARPGPSSSAKANFELGRCMGELETMIASLGLPFQEVTPQAWQKEFGISGDKRTHVDCAKRLFPGVSLKRTEKCTKDFDGFADALLMAEYARRRMA